MPWLYWDLLSRGGKSTWKIWPLYELDSWLCMLFTIGLKLYTKVLAQLNSLKAVPTKLEWNEIHCFCRKVSVDYWSIKLSWYWLWDYRFYYTDNSLYALIELQTPFCCTDQAAFENTLELCISLDFQSFFSQSQLPALCFSSFRIKGAILGTGRYLWLWGGGEKNHGPLSMQTKSFAAH